MKTYKFRLYPTKMQKKTIEKHLQICCDVYNKSLQHKKLEYEKNKTNLRLYDLHNLLVSWKKDNEEYVQVHSQVLQQTQKRLDFAFQQFFNRLKKGQAGFPRFKKHLRSLCYPQSGFVISNELKLSKIGLIKMRKHRQVLGTVKQVTITKYNSGKYFVNIVTDFVESKQNKAKKTCGIDLGIRTLVTCSDGYKIQNPKFMNRIEERLKKLHYRFSKNKSLKNKHSLALVYETLTNQRLDFIHKSVNLLLKRYKTVCIEKLDINSMNSYSAVNKSIRDVCWAKFCEVLHYKASNAGSKIKFVDPSYTSKTCSICGNIDYNFDLTKTTYNCSCGNKLNRDENAAINIMRRGLASP